MNYQLDCSPQKYSRVYEKNVAMWQEMIHFKEGWRCVKEGHNFEFWSNRTKKLKPYYFFSNGSNGKILRPFQTLWLHVVIKLTSLTCLRYNLTTGISECRLITIWSESIRDYNHHGGLHTKSTWRRCSRSQKVTFKGSIKYWHTHCKERVTFSFSDFSRVPYAFSMHFGWPKVFAAAKKHMYTYMRRSASSQFSLRFWHFIIRFPTRVNSLFVWQFFTQWLMVHAYDELVNQKCWHEIWRNDL